MKNYFLGIGIDSYKDGYLHQLKSAVRDVEKIEELLIEYYLFDSSNSILLLNEKAKKESIIKQVDQYHLIDEKFNLVIYFAGHGELHRELQTEEGYILPYDAYAADTDSYINQRDLLGRLEKIDNCHHLLLLWDSCFSGSLFDVSTRQRSNEKELVAYPSRWAITSGSRGEKVDDGTKLKHSPFADALKRTLHIQLDMIPASHLAKELQSFMVRNNHNPPLLAPLLMKGHEWGEFAFEMNSRYVEKTISTTILIPPVADPIVFFGRVEELHEIRQRLSRLSKGGHILLLHAEGGMGKTSLASKYWHNYQRAYKNMAWLNCQNGIYSDALPRLAMALGIEMDLGTDYLPILKKRLLAINDRFLLVMDNVDDAAEISSFQLEFGKLNLQILVTSRCQNVLVEKTQEMLLGSLPKHLAQKLFREFYSKESGTGFENLLDRFLDAIGSHTLLIEVFAKNLNEASTLSPTPLTMETFLGKLEESGLYLESDSFTMRTHYTGNVEKSAANTDDILNILYDFSKLVENERHLLANLALLPTQSHKLDFLQDIMQPEKTEEFKVLIEGLLNKGWVGGSWNDYRLSPVIQKLIIKKNKETLWEDGKLLIGKILSLITSDTEDHNGITLKFRWLSFSRELIKNFKNLKNSTYTKLLNSTALILHKLGGNKNTSEAKKLILMALDLNISMFGENSLPVAATLSNLSLVLMSDNGIVNLTEANKLMKRALEIETYHFDNISPSLASSISNFAFTLKELGGEANLNQAKILLVIALDSYVTNFGKNSPETANCMSNLALVLKDLGGTTDLLNAEELLESALNSDISNFGDDSPNVAVRRSNLAIVLLALKGNAKLLKAKKLFENAIQSDIKNFGKDSPKVALLRSNLAMVLKELGGKPNLTEAIGLLELAMESDVSNFGKNHPLVAIRHNNLAMVLKDLGTEKTLSDAARNMFMAMDSNISNFGKNHPKVIDCYKHLAQILQDLGGESNLLKAVHYFRLALESSIKNFGENAPSVSDRRMDLTVLLKELGGESNLIEARNLMQDSLQYDNYNFGENSPKAILRSFFLGLILIDLGGKSNLIEAKKLIENAWNVYIVTLGPDHPLTFSAMKNIEVINNDLTYIENESGNIY